MTPSMCRFRRAFGLLSAALFASGCAAGSEAGRPRSIVRVAPSALMQQLVSEYGRLLQDVTFEPVRNLQDANSAVLRGDIDLTLGLADAAYLTDVNSQGPDRRLRAIGALHVAPLHLLVRSGSGIRGLADLRGRRVGTVGDARISELVLKASGLDDAIVRIDAGPRAPLSTLYQGSPDQVFGKDQWDAAFVLTLYPATLVEDAVRAGADLVPVEAETLTQLLVEYPFLEFISIPAHAYPGQRERVRTIATPVLLVCRNDLDDELVYRLTAHLLDAVSRVPLYNSVLRHITVQDASATPIPLHDGAARYYREWEILR